MGHGLHAQAMQRLFLAFEGTNHTGLLAAMQAIFGDSEEESPAPPPAKKPRTERPTPTGDLAVSRLWDERAAKSALGIFPTTDEKVSEFGVEGMIPKPTKGAPTREYECPICQEEFSGRVTVISHLRRHYGVALACFLCKRQYWSSTNYQQHLKKEHPGVDVYALTRAHSETLPPLQVSHEVTGGFVVPTPPPRAPTATVSRPADAAAGGDAADTPSLPQLED